ncbi:transposase-like protein [Bradyrhizobium sp. GM22.5]
MKDHRGAAYVRKLRELGSSPRVCYPVAQVSEVARKHGATRWQIYDWRRRFRQRGMLSPREVSQPTFAPLVVEGALEERQVPAIKLEIAIGDVVLRTDTAIDGEQLSRVIRAMRASR